MTRIKVSAVQRACVFDGEGLRTTIFLQGCPLRCPWCCNPETQSDNQIWFDSSKCLKDNGIISELCNNCIKNGGNEPFEKCSFGASKPLFEEISPEDLLEICLRDKTSYEESGGGVTFSGGEPLLYSLPLTPVLKGLKDANVTINFETTLQVSQENIENAIPFTDCWIIDLKLQPEMFINNPDYLNDIKRKLSLLKDAKCIFRIVATQSVTQNATHIYENLSLLGIKEVQFLKAHNLGEKKYSKLHRCNIDYTPSDSAVEHFISEINDLGIRSSLLKI